MIKMIFIAILLAPLCLKAQDTSKRRIVDTTHQKPMSLSDTLVLRQFDGSSLHIVCNGNNFESYCETLDGYTLILDRIGIYDYAKSTKDGNLIPNGVPARDAGNRDPKEQRIVKRIPKHLRYTGATLEAIKAKEKKVNEDPAILKRYKKN